MKLWMVMYLFTVEPTLLSQAHRLPRCSLVVVPVIRGEVGYCHLLFISSFLSSLFLSRRSLSLVSSSHFIDFFYPFFHPFLPRFLFRSTFWASHLPPVSQMYCVMECIGLLGRTSDSLSRLTLVPVMLLC